jgi:FMN phosphatase YigB (HAD superfamily)
MINLKLKKIIQKIIKESTNKEKKLVIFDFDDTLAKTESKVFVKKQDGNTIELTPGQYAKYVKEPGDEFDYSEFEDLIKPKEIEEITSILRSTVSDHGIDSALILTARGKEEPVERFLRKFKLPEIQIVALGNSHPDLKAFWILAAIKKHNFNKIVFYDDSSKNINAVNNLQKKYKHYGADVEAILVK